MKSNKKYSRKDENYLKSVEESVVQDIEKSVPHNIVDFINVLSHIHRSPSRLSLMILPYRNLELSTAEQKTFQPKLSAIVGEVASKYGLTATEGIELRVGEFIEGKFIHYNKHYSGFGDYTLRIADPSGDKRW